MEDESLVNIVERWDEFSWIDRKLIWWRCVKHRHKITGKQIISLATVLSIFIIAISEQRTSHITGLLAIIVLLYFYVMLADYIWGKAA